ncbi:hypothetical protein AFR_11610 [Actinoplanes friuliensis DSM 7358]|uniref:VanZ-like domain-containing protein n=1 Tax=Actinoplanes friuliensis DSM 7358 TaxID=1246995 RepID=U5VY98_9ACTN|nr:hypothetical protein AFR_11610 [Actinoplanes friuliensis DSM 7358]
MPALPILVPLGVLLMIVSWAGLRRHDLLSAPRLATAWLAGWYLVAVLGATMLPLHLSWGPYAGEPAYYRIILVPLTTMRVDDFVLNTVMTLPLAAVLRLVFGVHDKVRVVPIALALSASIEITQAIIVLTVHGNRWADVNDLISNTLGAYLGYLALKRLLRFEVVRRVAERCALVPGRSPAIRS